MSDYKKTVLAVDASIHAEKAVEFYLKMLYKKEHEVHLVHAMECPAVPHQGDNQKDAIAKMFEISKKGGEDIEKKFREMLDKANVKYVVHNEFGDAGEIIVQICQEQDACMVVLGTRGMGVYRRTLMGSVSDYVVQHVSCPVVVNRIPMGAHAATALVE